MSRPVEGSRPRGRLSSSWALPVAIVLLALLIRVVAIAADPGYEPRHDSFDYDRHARSIAAGDGFPESGYVPGGGPSALRAPAYPFVLGAVYAVAGDSVTAGRLLGAILGAVTVLLLYLLVLRIWGARIAALAAALAAVYPPLIALSTELYSENLFIPLLLAAVIAVLRFRESAGLGWAALAGALAGAAALTRGPGVVALLPLLYGLWMLRPRLSAGALAAPAVAAVCALLVIAPWAIRNAVEFGRFVPIATSTGFGLAGTYNDVSRDDPTATAAWRTPAIVPEYAPLFRAPDVDEATLDATLRAEATGYMADHPGYVAEAIANNLLRLLYLQGDSVVAYQEVVSQPGIGNRGSAADKLGLAIAAALAVVGIATIVRSRGAGAPGRGRMASVTAGPTFLWLVPIALILVALPAAGLPRYRVPADPFLLILAAIGVARILDRFSGHRRLATAAAAAALLTLGAGCGGSADPATTASDRAEPVAGSISRDAYVRRADSICRKAIDDARALVAGGFETGDSGSGGLALTTKTLVAPGIAIRARQATRIRALPRPAGDSAALDTFVGLFDPIDELSRQRLRAGLAGDMNESLHLERLLGMLALEQQRSARRYGFDDCSTDVIGAAFR